MTRKELIESPEYVTATIECIIVSKKGVKQMRRELGEAFLAHQKELIEVNTPTPSVEPVDYKADNQE